MSIQGDADEFAALLRRLKDRTDRSYGSLARRLNMNTSTLHRYCAGDAVPQDYAPVERLAAFCGATPQERLELHRLWLSAVAARQRVRTADAPEAVTTAPAPAPDPAPAAPTASEEKDEAEDAHTRAHADTDGPLAGQGGPAEHPGDHPDPDGRSPSSAPRPLPWYRRRSVLASTAAACALLALTLVGFSALSDGRSSEAEPDPSGTGPTSTGTTTPGGADRPTNASADPPLTWSVDPLVWDKGCDHDYVIDKPAAQVPPPPSEQDAEVWAATQNAVHGRRTKVRISVQGKSSAAVVLDALHVRVVGRDTPDGGTAYNMGQGCGSELTPRRFTVNLDADRPIVHPKDGEDGADGGRVLPAVRFPYRVSADDPEVLLVDATTQTYDARWYLELDWSSQGRTGTIRIDDDGRPFHTASIKGMPRYWYGTDDAGQRAWVPLDSD
ncbi:helix-turn-helix transcriptional regulator [Streptomyces sp. AC495_CC817]|uniref:helix-turn-helix domain-containing protein n=1 Tax=Streptomyces sp. AC495_CC817 TaxID=2823900 RepID=UPI001C273CF3|nr:helix-turn-helix transcriptional regulator [Streptomyces sp. AC495_CC817]